MNLVLWAIVVQFIYYLWWKFQVLKTSNFWDKYPKVLKFLSKLWASQKFAKLGHHTCSNSSFLCLMLLSFRNIFYFLKKLALAVFLLGALFKGNQLWQKGLKVQAWVSHKRFFLIGVLFLEILTHKSRTDLASFLTSGALLKIRHSNTGVFRWIFCNH